MPSLLLGNPLASGGQDVLGANPFSGLNNPILPYAGIRFTLDISASGSAYIALSGAGIHPGSGGQTFNSGGFVLSGGGNMDGMQLRPGTSLFIPSLFFKNAGSGMFNIGALVDPAGSGQARLYWEPDVMIY